MTVTFFTRVLDVPASPMGLLPPSIVIDHCCNVCRQSVATSDLAGHARSHRPATKDEGGAID